MSSGDRKSPIKASVSSEGVEASKEAKESNELPFQIPSTWGPPITTGAKYGHPPRSGSIPQTDVVTTGHKPLEIDGDGEVPGEGHSASSASQEPIPDENPESKDQSGSRSREQQTPASGSLSQAGGVSGSGNSGAQEPEGSRGTGGRRGQKRRGTRSGASRISVEEAESRKQKRLAKNRVTAAVSRERKRAQLTELQERLKTLEKDNKDLNDTLAVRDEELKHAREELASLSRGASGIGRPAARASESAVGTDDEAGDLPNLLPMQQTLHSSDHPHQYQELGHRSASVMLPDYQDSWHIQRGPSRSHSSLPTTLPISRSQHFPTSTSSQAQRGRFLPNSQQQVTGHAPFDTSSPWQSYPATSDYDTGQQFQADFGQPIVSLDEARSARDISTQMHVDSHLTGPSIDSPKQVSENAGMQHQQNPSGQQSLNVQDMFPHNFFNWDEYKND